MSARSPAPGAPEPAGPALLVVAAEASGDRYAAAVVRALRERLPSVRVFGVGGPALRDAGLDTLARAEDLAVTGLVEALGRIPAALRAMRAIRAHARSRRPPAALLIDSPDLNLRLVRALAAAGVAVFYYISPQLWAWRAGRVRLIRAAVARMLVIFPFEVAFYRSHGVEAEFVGHPLIDETRASADHTPVPHVVALLPGSRPNEVRRILPALLGAAARLHAADASLRFVLPIATTLDAAPIEAAAAACGAPVTCVRAPLHGRGLADALALDAQGRPLAAPLPAGATEHRPALAVTASGTATVELALLGLPMIVVYRMSALTYALGRLLVRVPHIGMVNLLAGERAAPELLQSRCAPGPVAAEVRRLLDDATALAAQRTALARVRAALGGGGAARRVAAALAATLAPHAPTGPAASHPGTGPHAASAAPAVGAIAETTVERTTETTAETAPTGHTRIDAPGGPA